MRVARVQKHAADCPLKCSGRAFTIIPQADGLLNELNGPQILADTVEHIPDGQARDGQEPFPIELGVAMPRQEHQVRTRFVGDSTGWLLPLFTVEATHPLSQRCSEPVAQVRIPPHEPRSEAEEMPDLPSVLRVSPDVSGVRFSTRMLTGGQGLSTLLPQHGHADTSSPRAWRYSATTTASVTRV